MKGKPRPTWSPGREAWLRKLEMVGAAVIRGQGATGFCCRILGWTAWANNGVPGAEVITDAGREVLARWKRGEVKPLPLEPAEPQPTLDAAMAGLTLDKLIDWIEATGRGPAVLEALRRQPVRAHQEPQEPPLLIPAPMPTSRTARTLDAAVDAAGAFVRACCVDTPIGQVCDAPHAAPLAPYRTPSARVECPTCSGRGVRGQGLMCPACKGTGTVQRTVPA